MDGLDRSWRRRLAGVLVLALLLWQFALAAHACPATPRHAVPCAMGEEAPAPHAAALCADHCKGDPTLADAHAPAPPLPMLVSLWVVPPRPAAALRPAAPPHPQADARGRAPPPSVAVLHCCLRI